MKLRNRKSYMTSLPEGHPAENIRPRFTQLIYYFILLAIVFYIIYLFSSRYFYFNESGFVEVEKTIISSSYGGKVIKLPVKEGQSLTYSKLLAIIAASKNCNSSYRINTDKLKYDLALNRAKLSLLKREVNNMQNFISNSNLQRALETSQSNTSTSNNIKLDLIKKQNEITLLDSTIKLQQQRKPTNFIGQTSPECFDETLKSPFSGYVHSIKRKVNEFTSRGTPLLVLIADDATVRIETYLKNDQLPFVKIGENVSVEFSNGTETKAKIKNIYSSAYAAPEREWNHYKPLNTQVRVHLEPVNKQDALLWKKFDRMEVNVRGRK